MYQNIQSTSPFYIKNGPPSPPREAPTSFFNWKRGGVRTFKEVMKRGWLMPKERIEDVYHINIPWFEFVQFSHLYKEQAALGKLVHKKIPFDQILSGDGLPERGLLSFVYQTLKKTHPTKEFAYQKAWKKELGMNFGDQSWSEIRSSSLFQSQSTNTLMCVQKTLHRWHLTPVRLHKSLPQVSDRCWKGCGLQGTHLHSYWACPKLQGFWSSVFCQITTVTGAEIRNSPELAILSHWGKTTLEGRN